MLEFSKMKNFYPEQYIRDNNYQINHNYLKEQFSDCDEILLKIKEVINNSDYTLGKSSLLPFVSNCYYHKLLVYSLLYISQVISILL